MRIRTLAEYAALDQTDLSRADKVEAMNDALELLYEMGLPKEVQLTLAEVSPEQPLDDMIAKIVNIIVTYRLD